MRLRLFVIAAVFAAALVPGRAIAADSKNSGVDELLILNLALVDAGDPKPAAKKEDPKKSAKKPAVDELDILLSDDPDLLADLEIELLSELMKEKKPENLKK